jgi:hypothetical protein
MYRYPVIETGDCQLTTVDARGRTRLEDHTRVLLARHVYVSKNGPVLGRRNFVHTCGNAGCVNADHVMLRVDAVARRFWAKVHVGDPDQCWEWQGAVNNTGYGIIGINSKSQLAHRTSFALRIGDPAGLLICHTCDNRKCVNPHHLYGGTHQDNANDRVRRGRSFSPIGEKANRSKLTREQVEQIRCRYAAGGVSQDALAAEYGVTQPSVSAIILRKTWNHF